MANKKPLIVAIIFGIIAVVLVYAYLRSVEKQQAEGGVEYGTVVVASDQINVKTTISESMVHEEQWPLESIPENAYTEMDEVLGQVSMGNIYKGVFLFPDQFKEAEDLGVLAGQLGPQERAITIGVTEIVAVGGNVQTGDYVDILASFKDNEEVGAPTVITAIRDVRVAAVGTDIGADFEEAEGEALSKSITLAVSPEDAETLTLISDNSNIRLSLRPMNEKYSPPSKGVTVNDIVDYRKTREDLEKDAKEADRMARQKEQLELEWRRSKQNQQNASDDGDSTPLGPMMPRVNRPKNVTVEIILGGESETVTVPESLYSTSYSVQPKVRTNFGVRYGMPYEN